MRRRVVLMASLLVSLAAHAAALAALSSSGPRVTTYARRPIDVELVVQASPARAPGPFQPQPSPSGPVATARPAGGGGPRRVASRAIARAPQDAEPATPRAARAAVDALAAPSAAPPPPPEAEQSGPPSPSPPVEGRASRGEANGDAEGIRAPARGEAVAAGLSSDGGPSWKRPEPAERSCFQEAVRLPAGLRGIASGTFAVKFAVEPDGKPGDLEILGKLPDERVGSVVWRAIQACRWTPGTDLQGRPAKVWIVMPVRFERG